MSPLSSPTVKSCEIYHIGLNLKSNKEKKLAIARNNLILYNISVGTEIYCKNCAGERCLKILISIKGLSYKYYYYYIYYTHEFIETQIDEIIIGYTKINIGTRYNYKQHKQKYNKS